MTTVSDQTSAPSGFLRHAARERYAREWVVAWLDGKPLPPSPEPKFYFSESWKGPGRWLFPDRKVGHALSVQILGNCRPTPTCMKVCYAICESCVPHNCHRKWACVDEMLRRASADPTGERESAFLAQLTAECQKTGVVRLLSHGDLSPEHLPALRRVVEAASQTVFFGFTRKTEIATAVAAWRLANLALHLSIDRDRGAPEDFSGTTAYLRMTADEPVGPSRVIVAFDHHINGRPQFRSKNTLRCPGYDDKIDTEPVCLSCQRCLPKPAAPA
jgi:hypothetical protein